MMLQDVLSLMNAAVYSITPFINKIIAAIIIVYLGFILGKITRSVLLRVLQDAHKTSKHVFHFDWSKEISTIASYAIYAISFVFAFNELGVTKIVSFGLLALVLILVIISLLLSVKDLIPNVRTGFLLRKKFTKGEKVRVEKMSGRVQYISPLETTIERSNGDIFIIPNNIFFKLTEEKKIDMT